MFRSLRSVYCVLLLGSILLPWFSAAQELRAIDLPKPQTDGGRPLMQLLRERKSTREFSPEKLPLQVLSNLLWAANGINRPDGHRTAPSGSNRQEIDIYVATHEGVYLYEPQSHRLQPLWAGDQRAATGTQDYVGSAAVNLVYVADLSKLGKVDAERLVQNPAAAAGCISQNVYLYCASEGLGAVVRASIDKPALAKRWNLRESQRIVLAQSVGYAKK